MPTKIPDRLHLVAEQFGCSLTDFEHQSEPIDWDQVFDWLRFQAGESRAEEERDIEDRYATIEAELDEIELEIAEESAP